MSFGGAAQAEVYGGGPVYGGFGSIGGTAVCRIFNFGPFDVPDTIRQLWNNVGSQVSLGFDSCNTTLASGGSCAYGANISGNFAYSCAIAAESSYISGSVEIQKSGEVLNTQPMHR